MGTQTAVRRLLVVTAAGCAALGLAAALPAVAAPGAGTWTEITSPADGRAFLSQVGHEGHLTVKGRASSDVTQVNVYCLNGVGSAATAITVATTVAVTSGSFSATVPVPGGTPTPQCRMRALPDGVNPQAAYVASYAGPVVHFDSWQASATDFQLSAGAGDTLLTASSVGACSTAALVPVAADQTTPGGSDGCLLSLGQNAAGTRAGVVVDGHPAFPPFDATRFGVTPRSTVHASFRRTKQDTVRWTDSESLDRCTTDGAFPPGPSCVLTSTGVRIDQVLTQLRSGQVRIRTAFVSTDGRRHVVRLAYACELPVDQGQLGVRFPGQKAFKPATAGRKVTRLGHGVGTMLARTDRFGDEGDPTVATRALTWSRPPSSVRFSPTRDTSFELDYRLVVPRRGSVRLGFADSVAVRTTGAVSLGRHGARDMMPAPRVSSPRPGSTVSGSKLKVTGVVTAGANGLPVSVDVSAPGVVGGQAKLKPNKAGTRAKYVITLTHVGQGSHRITVMATDAVGLRRSTKLTVKTK